MPSERDFQAVSERRWNPYGVAIAASIAGLGLRGLFDRSLGDTYPFIFAFAAVVLSAAYGGWKPAFVSIVLSYAGCDWYFVAPRRTVSLAGGKELVAMGSFLFTTGVITIMAELMRRAERRAKATGVALAAEREQWRVTLSSIGDAVVTTDDRQFITFLNPVAEQLSGWKLAEARGRMLSEVLPLYREGTGEIAANPLEIALRDRVIVAMANHTVLRTRAGAEIPIEDSAAPIIMPDGSLRGGIIVFHDASTKRARQRALRSAEWLARTALEVGRAGAWVWEVAREVVVADPAFARLHGVAPERARAGEPLSTYLETIHVDDRDIVEKAIRHSLDTGEGFRQEYRVGAAGAPERWVSAHARIEQDPDDGKIRMPGILVDITESRAAEAQLRAEKERAELASQAKDKFLAALSHELRTPLMPVLMTATFLAEDERLPVDIREDLEMIRRNIALEARLIDDLLDLTRIAQGKLELRTEACDAHEVIDLALKIVREEAREKPVTLQVDLAAERTVLDADPARLQQVFWNVLRNAIKFTPAGGSVSMRTWNSMAGSLFIEVSDTGIGIPGEALDRIFQPFEQAGEESIHRFGGIGLGLAIARAILDLHDGTISARSDGVDRGSTFMIELPRAAARVSADGVRAGGDGASTSDHAARNGRIRLLLVEDHEPTLTVLQRLLLRAGHDVVTASTAESAISAAAGDKKFDGVISDLGLPDGTGYELLGKLRALHPEIEAIALSGYGMEEDLQRSRDAGFMTHLVKPIDFQQLNVALQEVAKKSGAAAARERGTAGVSERTDANP